MSKFNVKMVAGALTLAAGAVAGLAIAQNSTTTVQPPVTPAPDASTQSTTTPSTTMQSPAMPSTTTPSSTDSSSDSTMPAERADRN